jgi:hypothetical protein
VRLLLTIPDVGNLDDCNRSTDLRDKVRIAYSAAATRARCGSPSVK